MIAEVLQRIQPFIHQSPILTSRRINDLTKATLFFKCENFQKTGSFKIRGATNAILTLNQEERNKGVVTHSSGNFAQAVALAAKLNEIVSHIVMPRNAPEAKRSATLGYGAKIYDCESSIEARESKMSEIQDLTKANELHPSNQIEVIYGQGTCAYELYTKVQGLDCIITPVGGGGLVAGTCLAMQELKGADVYGAEPMEADDAFRSLQTGIIERNESVNTIADGLRTNLGNVNFPIIQEHIKEILLVSEEQIISSMKLIWATLKIVVEPSSATVLAAVMNNKEKFAGKRIGLILSGGNVDLNKLPF
ncbi:MAG: pyridoxal-phosphate dependent enzyme [Flavobacteriales bacterium]|nr:pyridoxal-phosphate dependent enzyme [Flavobacteriales bacterium]